MKCIRMGGLCLVAAFAFSAVAMSSASAGQLLVRFSLGGSVVGASFLSAAGVSTLESTGKKVITCSTVRNHGSFLSSTLGLVLIVFIGCKETVMNTSCDSAGAGAGEIYIPLSTLFHVGLAHSGTNTTIPAIIILLPSAGINFTCDGGAIKVKVTGNVIGELQSGGAQAPLNVPFRTLALVFRQTTGVQALKLILLGSQTLTNQHLTSEINGTVEEAGESSTDILDGFRNSMGEETIELVEP
jgi:hypothetical protein